MGNIPGFFPSAGGNVAADGAENGDGFGSRERKGGVFPGGARVGIGPPA
jgi:hypothetical protein